MNQKITNSFEGIEQVTKAAGQQVKKIATDVARDVQESFAMTDAKELPKEEKQQIKKDDQKNVAAIRQNLNQINQQIAEIKKQREQKQVEQKKQTEQKAQGQKFEEKKKDSALAQMIKSRKGTKEGMQRASG